MALAMAPSSARALDGGYSTFDYAACKEIDRGVGYSTRSCVGPGGLAVVYTGDEGAASVAFGTRGLVGDIPLDGSFAAGKTIEWRGEKVGGVLTPRAAILRYDVGPSPDGPFRSRLLVYKLVDKSASCVAATIAPGGASANLRARRIADDIARTFVCGKDKPRLDQ
jgi:hypothetical protein